MVLPPSSSPTPAKVQAAYWYAGEEIREQGLAMGAEGIIGVQLDSRKWRSASMHMAIKMILTVVGTAIVAIPDDETRRPDQQTGLRIVPGPAHTSPRAA